MRDNADKREKQGPWHEKPGVLSIRRIAATFLFLTGAYFFYKAAVTNGQWAFYSGLANELGGILLLLFTTWTDLTSFTQSLDGVIPGNNRNGSSQSFSNFRPSSTNPTSPIAALATAGKSESEVEQAKANSDKT